MEKVQTPPVQLPGETPEQYDIRINKDVAAFSYIWIMSIVVYAARRESPFVHYHAKQAIVLFLLSIPAGLIPYLGKFLVLICFAGMVLGFINAAQGHYRDVPYAGPLSRGELKLSEILDHAVTAMRRVYEVIKSMFHRAKPPAPTPPAATVQTPPAPVQNAPTPTSVPPMPVSPAPAETRDIPHIDKI